MPQSPEIEAHTQFDNSVQNRDHSVGSQEGSSLTAYHTAAAEALRDAKSDIVQILSTVATRSSIDVEFTESLRVLAHAYREQAWVDSIPSGRNLSVFLPSNNLLYSYVLYGVMPGAWASQVRTRPSSRVKSCYLQLHEVLERRMPGAVTMTQQSQREFVASAVDSDVVVFTGDPDNGRRVADQLTERQLFLGLGSGPNPVVVGPDADIPQAVSDTVSARLYNAGQDCLCPDIIFVHRRVMLEFEEALIEAVKCIPQADRTLKGLVNAPLVYDDAAETAHAWLSGRADQLRWQAQSTSDTRFVPISVVRGRSLAEADVQEHFGPIFHIVPYDTPVEIHRWAHSADALKSGFYCSVYGEPGLQSPLIGSAINVGAASALNSEDGNAAFGGYGPRASWVRTGGLEIGMPVLVSREVSAFQRA